MDVLVFLLTLLSLIVSITTIGLSLILIIIKAVKKDYYDLINFLGNYKKGVFSLVYVSVFLVQLANHLFVDQTLTLSGVFNVINNTINSFVLSINLDELSTFISHLSFYALSVRIVYIIVLINLGLFIVSICLPFILRCFLTSKIKRKDQCVIFIGHNNKTNEIIKSLNKKYSFILVDYFTNEEKLNLMKKVYYFVNLNEENYSDLTTRLNKLINKLKLKKVHIIIDKENNENLIITKAVSDLIQNINLENYDINGYVLGEDQNKDAFFFYIKKSMGRIHYVNKYQMIAFDFISKYPLTEFMNNDHIDYNNGLLKESTNMNVYFVGFGNVNKHLLSASICNNQFIYQDNNNTLKTKLVNYFIYDKNEYLSDKNLNHYLNRFTNETFDKEYLSREVKTSNINLRPTHDINSTEFYSTLQDDIKNSKSTNINYIIVSIGNELENIDFTYKLLTKLSEWNVLGTTKVFCRIQNSKYLDSDSLKKAQTEYIDSSNQIKLNMFNDEINQTVLKEKQTNSILFYPFGMEDKLIYNLDNILNNEIETLGKLRHLIYYLEYNKASTNDNTIIDSNTFNKLLKESNISWYHDLTQIQRDSNLYVLYNLKTKLQLLGFDFVKENEQYNQDLYDKVTFEEFNKIYLKNSYVKESFKMKYVINNNTFEKVFYQSDEFYEGSTRWNLAVQEHYRWNAYHLSHGIVPSSIDVILSDVNNGKDINGKRTHPNITTMDGLKRYAKIMAVKNYVIDTIKEQLQNKNEAIENIKYLSKKIASDMVSNNYDKYELEFEKLDKDIKEKYLNDNDVIKYDFQFLDDIEWLFKVNNYQLLKIKSK